jgi:hypothetical protein
MPLRRPPEPPPTAAPDTLQALQALQGAQVTQALQGPQALQPLHPQDAAEPATGPGAAAATAWPAGAPEPEPTPSAAQLRSAARELAQAAERAERSAREMLGRAHTLCESLARSLEASDRRACRDTLAVLLSGLLLCAATAVLATVVTLHAVDPRWSVLRLLRTLLHGG